MTKHPIAIYGSHDSSISVRISASRYKVYELERITGIRNYSLNKDPNAGKVLLKMFNYLKEWHGFEAYDSLFYSECSRRTMNYIISIFKPIHTEWMQHHKAHAATALWQSPFEKSLIISFDGGGNDGAEGTNVFSIFIGDKKTNSFDRIGNIPLNLCDGYTRIAWSLNEIKKKDESSYLSWAGKIMGLVAYGRVNFSWIDFFRQFYNGNIDKDSLNKLYKNIGYNGKINEITDFKIQADIAATSQAVFEGEFFGVIYPYVNEYKLPICITGGGGLNVILNQQMYYKYLHREIFVPCNPNDCGLSLGSLLLKLPPDSGKMDEIMYEGFPILDFEKTTDTNYLNEKNINVTRCDLKRLANVLTYEDKIIGFMKGCSEVGPRALGNRSILCYPDSINKKDLVNKKVKFRESFRPFSPVIREEDATEYFTDGPFESKYMTYSQNTNESFRQNFPAVVHEDGTARLQTVTEESNSEIYNLLSEIQAITGYGVLMNTSFNSKGKPILTTVEEAIQILCDTDLDAAWIEGLLFERK